MAPSLVNKPQAARAEKEYVMTPAEEQAYWESFEDEKHGRFLTDAELRKKLGL
jgi:hypothetical protein